MVGERLHDLLPWYLNGTLEAAERRTFEQHLDDCAPCRDEMRNIESLKGAIERHGEAFLATHVSPETLVSLWMPGGEPLGAEQETAARRHVALCASCAQESRWLQGTKPVGAESHGAEIRPDTRALAPVETPSAPWDWRSLWRWGATAAAAILALVLIARPKPDREAGGLVPPPHLLEAQQRAAARGTEVRIRPQDARLRLIFETDLGSGAFPLSLEIDGPHGAVLYRRSGISAEDLLSDRFVLLDFERGLFPDGEYVLRLTGASGRADERIEYPFRVLTER